jgi:hypothetical protein
LSNNSKSETFVPNADKETKEMIQSALVAYLKEKIEEKNNSRKNYDALISVVEEFLNSFIILGYNFDGQPLQYICAHNQQQADSLATLVNKFFQNAMQRDEDEGNDD